MSPCLPCCLMQLLTCSLNVYVSKQECWKTTSWENTEDCSPAWGCSTRNSQLFVRDISWTHTNSLGVCSGPLSFRNQMKIHCGLVFIYTVIAPLPRQYFSVLIIGVNWWRFAKLLLLGIVFHMAFSTLEVFKNTFIPGVTG